MSRTTLPTPAQWKRTEEIFNEAVDLPTDVRASFLDEACGGDVALRREVERLLTADSNSTDSGLEPVAGGLDSLCVGLQIATYTLVRQLGEGGMGSVWLAERIGDGFRKNVAIKVVKRGVDTDEVLRRFRRERQVLARMQHPYIATLMDGGATEDGRPYLVMEHIDGTPITEYCNDKSLDLRSRLELFIKVCEAVHYAHRNLVIHRDLKPSNILVDREGVPKLLDFGIAKLLDEGGGDVVTTQGPPRLTPRYASPEQFRSESLTTATDVYALGVILFEMLTGKSPYEVDTRSREDFQRAACELQPKRPSAVSPDRSETTSQTNTSTRRMRRKLEGDVDTIVLKALRKEPERRYHSVQELANDIERYLNGLPVKAQPDTVRYRTSKFVRRNRALVTSLSVLVLVLAVSTAVVSVLYARSVSAHEAEIVARNHAERQAAIAQAVNSFLNDDLLAAADPFENPDPNEPVRNVLDRASVRIENQFPDQPLVEASVRVVLAQAYINLSEFDVAETHIVAAISIFRSETNPGAVRGIHAQATLADLYADRAQFDQAEEIYRKQLSIAEQTLGPNDEQTLAIITGLGITLWDRGQLHEATELARRAVKGQHELHGWDHANTIRALTGLTSVLTDASKYDEAETVARQAYDSSLRVFGEKHVTVSTCLDNLGRVLIYLRRPEEAVPLFERSLAISKELVGEEHLHTLITMTNVATGYQRLERWDEAEAILKKSIATKLRTIGATHPSTLIGKQTLANQYHKQGRLEEALQLHRQVLEGRIVTFGEDHPSTLSCMNNLAGIHREMGNYSEAVGILREIRRRMKESFGPDHPRHITIAKDLASLLIAQKQYKEAESMLVEDYETITTSLGPRHDRTRATAAALAEMFESRQDMLNATVWKQRAGEEPE